jgi:GntR family transcriptional regulator
MLLKIDFESDIPIYIQIRRHIIEGIAKGELTEGESLPSVRQLAQDIGINMLTVNKAYTLLKNDGFVNIDRRKGAVISRPKGIFTEQYKEQVREDMAAIIAEAYCRGMEKDTFFNMCREIYESFDKESKS